MNDHAQFTASDGPYAWARQDLELVIGLDILTGYGSSKVNWGLTELQRTPEFGPGRPITRAEFATVLARVTGFSDQYRPGSKAPFRDTPDHAWYQPYLAPLAEKQIVRLTDYPFDQLGPEEPITRVEIAAWVARAARAYGIIVHGGPTAFTDVPAVYQYRQELQQAVALGVITGYPDGTFRPESTATRAEAAVMTARLVKRLVLNAPDAAQLQAVVQTAYDAYDLYSRDNPGPGYDQYGFRRSLSKFYATSALTWWGVEDDRCTQRTMEVNRMEMLCGQPTGYASSDGRTALLSRAAQFVYDQQTGWWYHTHTVTDLLPLLVTDRFAVVMAESLVYPFTLGQTKPDKPYTVREKVFLRKEGGDWKVSLMEQLEREPVTVPRLNDAPAYRLDGMNPADLGGTL